MTFWITLAAYEAAWFCAVIGAGHDQAWPGILATAVFAAWRLKTSRHRLAEYRLMGVALMLGGLMEFAWVRGGLLQYAAPWPLPSAPAWILGLWICLALTILPLFGYLFERPLWAALFGAIGGPLAYLGAGRGWHAVSFATPLWHAMLALAIGWAIALPTLTLCARRWSRQAPGAAAAPSRSAA